MLITISGGVGSGKTTTAAVVVELLTHAGLRPRYLRFRYLRLFGLAGNPKRPSVPGAEAATTRGRGFSLRRLTAARTVAYAARIVAFRLSGVGTASRCDILNRYFYDNFVQYRMTSRRERSYAFLLRRLIPIPDLAILLVASDQTISTRRPNYAREYVVVAGRRYGELPDLFPHMVRICTDAGSSADEEIRRVVQPLIDGGQQASARAVS